ncbi:hypothetical protein PV325_010458 [Microctonus aethiopoides]|nr:hypothetical protein PV325_010458 [Microctonus aethiopoides]
MTTTTTTTTTGDSSTMKSSATLSGGDLVSRLLAATPPYLYNVPLTSHSFFFSEMLRSFVQAKSEADTCAAASVTAAAAAAAAITPAAIAKRRKRSWRDTRERPLELTTKDKNIINHNSHAHSHHHHHHHTHHHPANQQEKYFHQELMSNGFKITESLNESTKNFQITNNEQKSNGFSNDLLKPVDENCPDFVTNRRHFFDDSSRLFGNGKIIQKDIDEKTFDERSKIGQEINFLMEQNENKMDFSGRNFSSGLISRTKPEDILQTSKGFELPGAITTTIANTTSNTATIAAVTNNTTITTTSTTATNNNNTSNHNNNSNIPVNNDFIPTPMWYPPYPMAQSYPGIDPLHFFIDLRVSGHIWDRKLSERSLPFKGKHCSAFSVPQSKEYNNHPLNLTRDEATTSRSSEENYRGTHFILKNLTKTYKDIGRNSKIMTKCEIDGNQRDSESVGCESSAKEEIQGDSSPSSQHECQEEETTGGKDLRALIGLELVVDYVKEPKEEPIAR